MRWHHGHSLGTGAVGGLILAGSHIMLLCGIMFTLGVGATIVAVNLRRIAKWLSTLLTRSGRSSERNYIELARRR